MTDEKKKAAAVIMNLEHLLETCILKHNRYCKQEKVQATEGYQGKKKSYANRGKERNTNNVTG